MAWTAEPPVASIGSRISTLFEPERRKLAIIASGNGRFLVTFETDITNAHVGQQIGERLHHGNPGAEDWDDDDRLRKDAARMRLERSFDGYFSCRQDHASLRTPVTS